MRESRDREDKESLSCLKNPLGEFPSMSPKLCAAPAGKCAFAKKEGLVPPPKDDFFVLDRDTQTHIDGPLCTRKGK